MYEYSSIDELFKVIEAKGFHFVEVTGTLWDETVTFQNDDGQIFTVRRAWKPAKPVNKKIRLANIRLEGDGLKELFPIIPIKHGSKEYWNSVKNLPHIIIEHVDYSDRCQDDHNWRRQGTTSEPRQYDPILGTSSFVNDRMPLRSILTTLPTKNLKQ